jgi:methionine synthase II (cobalamin-independent)
MDSQIDVSALATEINSGVGEDIKTSIKTISIDRPDLTNIGEQYEAWSDEFKAIKKIRGTLLSELNAHFYIDTSVLESDTQSTEALNKLNAECVSKLKEAGSYLRTAKLKYNAALTSASIKYLVHYESMLDPSVEQSIMGVRNATKEKIKMLAEAKNKDSIALALLAHEEVEYFEGLVEEINKIMSAVRIAQEARRQEIKLGSYEQ